MANKEGFWRSVNEPNLPMPAAHVGVWPAKDNFLARLKQIESKCPTVAYRGFSTCRICGAVNGSQEFKTDDWIWPAGFRHYVEEHDVRPTPAFEKAVLGR